MGEVEPIRWLDLTVQVATLMLIIYGYWVFKRRKNLWRHAYAFTLATILNAAVVLAIMVPLFSNDWAAVTTWPLDGHEVVLWAHHVLGLVVTLMSLFIVVRWGVNRRTAKRCRGRFLMDSTTLIWVAALILGFWLFAVDIVA